MHNTTTATSEAPAPNRSRHQHEKPPKRHSLARRLGAIGITSALLGGGALLLHPFEHSATTVSAPLQDEAKNNMNVRGLQETEALRAAHDSAEQTGAAATAAILKVIAGSKDAVGDSANQSLSVTPKNPGDPAYFVRLAGNRLTFSVAGASKEPGVNSATVVTTGYDVSPEAAKYFIDKDELTVHGFGKLLKTPGTQLATIYVSPLDADSPSSAVELVSHRQNLSTFKPYEAGSVPMPATHNPSLVEAVSAQAMATLRALIPDA